MTAILILLTIALLVGLLYFGFIYFVIRASLKPFRIPIYLSPGAMLCEQEYVEFDNDLGYKMPGWWVPGESDVVAIQLHGYMMNRCELVPTATWLAARGIGSLLVDLGGHGTAKRPDTGLGWPERMEVLACCKYVKSRNPNAKIILIGSSMGSAASAFAIGEDPDAADGLVLDSAYSSLDSAVSGWWRLFGPKWFGKLMQPASLIARPMVGYHPGEVNVAKALKKSKIPVLVLHGDRDRIALPSEAQLNIDALGDRATVYWFKNCQHSEGRWVLPDEYYSAIEGYLRTNGWLSYTSSP